MSDHLTAAEAELIVSPATNRVANIAAIVFLGRVMVMSPVTMVGSHLACIIDVASDVRLRVGPCRDCEGRRSETVR